LVGLSHLENQTDLLIALPGMASPVFIQEKRKKKVKIHGTFSGDL
jgi:hypothetical protein